MNDAQLIRYSRHILLNEIGIEGQAQLLAARVLVVGAGGLGCPAALYLGSAGVGSLTLVDDDTVEATNLQRQIAHRTAGIGQLKVESLKDAVLAINPDITIHTRAQRADAALLDGLVRQADVVLDCTDNFSTRHAINQACVTHRKPLVSGAALRFDGQLAVYDLRKNDSPCYACLFPETESPEETNCATMGVFAPLVGMVGTMQAAEALKLLCGAGHTLAGRLLMIDAKSMNFSDMALARSPACPCCGAHAGAAAAATQAIERIEP
jgi:molybdopterin-synthase adenylyltransferase